MPNIRQNKSIIGVGIFENYKTKNVKEINTFLSKFKLLKEIIETSFNR